MKIITWQLAEKLPRNHRLLINHTVNPQQDDSNLYSILTDNEKLTIYDATTTQEHLQNTIIGVNNHINRTGTNPLIGKQKKIGINFIDITNLKIIITINPNELLKYIKLNKKLPYSNELVLLLKRNLKLIIKDNDYIINILKFSKHYCKVSWYKTLENGYVKKDL